jgi:acetylornithine/succinyldiaminopimelate/putrescine aminotransferase
MASMRVLSAEKLVESCYRKSVLFKKHIVHELVQEIRGEGLLLAVRLRYQDCVEYAVAHAPEFGLILDYFLFCSDAFRIAPPLTISEDEIYLACTQICRLLDNTAENVKHK